MSISPVIKELVSAKAAGGEFSGVALVSQAGRAIFEEAVGFAHRPWRIANRVDTRFRVASVSKIFTATAVLRLVERGQISLDTPVIPRLDLGHTPLSPSITVEHLLTMTAGMSDWFDESTEDWEKSWAELCRAHNLSFLRENRDYLPLFIDQAPQFSPGERHAYNGAGYLLLGLLLEKVCARPYPEVIRDEVFSPAKMTRSGFFALDNLTEEVAEGYVPQMDAEGKTTGWRKNIYSATAVGAADGGAVCCAQDLVNFLQALRRGEMLSPALSAAMLTPKVRQFEEKVRGYTWMYGYGLSFLMDDDGQVVRYGLTGEEDGVSCRLYHYPGPELDVVILGNQSWCAGELAWEIHRAIS